MDVRLGDGAAADRAVGCALIVTERRNAAAKVVGRIFAGPTAVLAGRTLAGGVSRGGEPKQDKDNGYNG